MEKHPILLESDVVMVRGGPAGSMTAARGVKLGQTFRQIKIQSVQRELREMGALIP